MLRNKIMPLIDNLSDRDRNALLILAVFLLFCFIYWAGVISFSYRHQAVTAFESTRGVVWWVDTMSDKVIALRKDANTRLRDQSMLEIASADAAGLNITFKRVEPEGEDQVRLWVENVRFNACLMWLHRLNSEHRISVQQLQVEPTDVEGYVNVRLTLERRRPG